MNIGKYVGFSLYIGMETHFKFRDGEQRQFLLEIASKSELSTEHLAKIVGFSARSYRDWIKEKYAIAASAAKFLSESFSILLPEKENILTERWKNMKSQASKVGGFAHFRMYGSPATLEGRRKGGSKALKILRARGIIPSAKSFNFPEGFNNELAEFVGIVLGDGGVTKWQCTITLNRVADNDYVNFVSLLIKELFGEFPRVYEDKNSLAVDLCINGVSLLTYLKSIGIDKGDKVKRQVGVPEWISTKTEYKNACLRGLMDTDGGVFAHQYKVNGKEYIYNKICFTNQSVPLLMFAKGVLEDLGMHPKLTDYRGGSKKIWLYNQNEVDKYLRVVGSSNTRLLIFSKNWKRL